LSLLLAAGNALAQAQDEVRQMFERYIQAENEHNLATVGQALQDSKEMLWMGPRGRPVWGRDAVMQELTTMYQAAGNSSPKCRRSKSRPTATMSWCPGSAIRYTVGAATAPERYLVQANFVRTPIGWRISSIVRRR